jgi:CelD/BcsL family acetyltransferase involved in cellulose biosynthesis
MFKIEKCSTGDGFRALSGDWGKLLSRSDADNLFMTWEWLYNWWSVFEEGSRDRLSIFLIRENGVLLGIAPFYITDAGTIRARTLRFLGSYGLGSDYLDFILYRGREQELLSALFEHLVRSDTWDIIDITDIRKDSPSVELLKGQNFFRTKTTAHTVCPFLGLPDKWETLQSSFSKNLRYDINRKRRKFERDYKGSFKEITKMEELENAIEALIALNKARFTEKNIPSPFTEDRFSRFHRRIIPLFFEKNMLRLFFLTIDDEPVGCIYMYRYGEKYLFYQIGFDPKWNRISPGVLLFSYSIERAIEEGLKEFDLLQGDEKYKYRWASGSHDNLRLKLYRGSIKGELLYMTSSVLKSTISILRRVRTSINMT